MAAPRTIARLSITSPPSTGFGRCVRPGFVAGTGIAVSSAGVPVGLHGGHPPSLPAQPDPRTTRHLGRAELVEEVEVERLDGDVVAERRELATWSAAAQSRPALS